MPWRLRHSQLSSCKLSKAQIFPSRYQSFFSPTRNRIYEHFRNSTSALLPDYPVHVSSPKDTPEVFPTEGKSLFVFMRLRR